MADVDQDRYSTLAEYGFQAWIRTPRTHRGRLSFVWLELSDGLSYSAVRFTRRKGSADPNLEIRAWWQRICLVGEKVSGMETVASL